MQIYEFSKYPPIDCLFFILTYMFFFIISVYALSQADNIRHLKTSWVHAPNALVIRVNAKKALKINRLLRLHKRITVQDHTRQGVACFATPTTCTKESWFYCKTRVCKQVIERLPRLLFYFSWPCKDTAGRKGTSPLWHLTAPNSSIILNKICLAISYQSNI